ncbi:MAG: roadblock/LC7 domain-containing protein [Planctomycetota bacterium]
MKDLLGQLNEVPGVQGSMLITPDGIMVVAALGPNLDEDVVAAHSSSLLMTLQRALKAIDKDSQQPHEMILSAVEGKLFFSDLGNAFLVVVTKPNLHLGTGLVEIRSFSRKLKERCTLAL